MVRLRLTVTICNPTVISYIWMCAEQAQACLFPNAPIEELAHSLGSNPWTGGSNPPGSTYATVVELVYTLS